MESWLINSFLVNKIEEIFYFYGWSHVNFKKKPHIFGVIFIGKNIFFYKKKCLPKFILQRKFRSFSLNFPKN